MQSCLQPRWGFQRQSGAICVLAQKGRGGRGRRSIQCKMDKIFITIKCLAIKNNTKTTSAHPQVISKAPVKFGGNSVNGFVGDRQVDRLLDFCFT